MKHIVVPYELSYIVNITSEDDQYYHSIQGSNTQFHIPKQYVKSTETLPTLGFLDKEHIDKCLWITKSMCRGKV